MNDAATKYAVRDLLKEEAPFGVFTGKSHAPGKAALEYHTLYNPWELLPDPTQAAGKDANFDLTGTGTVPTPVQLARGGITVATRTTSAADNDEARLFPLATVSNWGTAITPADDKEQIIETRITLTQITETQFYFGWKLTDTGVVATDANQCLFLFDTDNTANFGPAGVGTLTASAKWLCINSSAGTDVAFETPTTVAASTSYVLRVRIGTDRRARFYINRKLVHTALTAIPTSASLLPTMGVASRASAGAAKSFSTRYISRMVSVP